MIGLKPSVIKPAKCLPLELLKDIEGGNDSEAREKLRRMEKHEVDYLLQLVIRFEGFIKVRHIR